MPNYYNGYPYGYQQQMQQMQQVQQVQQTMGLIEVSSEDEVNRYPVAPGNSVSFRNVNAPYIYTKTMVSQFGAPIIKKYRMIEEGIPEQTQNAQYATKDELAALAETVQQIMKKVESNE